jgi:hypothetical protein
MYIPALYLAPRCSYDIMMKCWKASPAERPSFSELQETFAGMLLQEVNYMQLSSLTDGIYALPVDALPTRIIHTPREVLPAATTPQEAHRYDQLAIPTTGNPYVISPQSSSVPTPGATVLNERSEVDGGVEHSYVEMQPDPSSSRRATLSSRQSFSSSTGSLKPNAINLQTVQSQNGTSRNVGHEADGLQTGIDTARYSNHYV